MINRTQPMRPAEIDLLNQVDTNTTGIADNKAAIADEVTNRTNADTALKTSITNIENRFPIKTEDIADNAVNAFKIEDGAVTSAKIGTGQVDNDKVTDKAITANKLSDDLQEQITFLKTVPQLSYGESEATAVSANSNVLVDVTFPNPLTEAPNVYCMARSTVCIECNVEQVTNSQVSIRLYNNTTTDAEQVSIDWLAISGR